MLRRALSSLMKMILIDSEDEESLKIFEEIKVKDREGNEVILDAYSADDDISVNQARIFMYESTTDRGVVSLPNDVLSALNNYLTPIKTKYESNYTKMFLLYKLLKKQTILTQTHNQLLN